MTGTIYGFLRDDAFRDLDLTARPLSATGSPFQPSDQSLSYYATGQTLVDTRETRPWLDGHDDTTRAHLIIDAAAQAGLGALFSALDQEERDSLFAILDRIFVLIAANETLSAIEADLTDDAAYSIYVAESLTLATGARSNATAYNSDDTVVSTPDWAQFSVTVTVDDDPEVLDFKVWVNDTAFKADYPISTITAIIPPLGYNTILTGPLSGGGTNAFDSAATAIGLVEAGADSLMRAKHQTGLHLQNIRLVDGGGGARLFPFGILHKGNVPTLLSIRTELRESVLGSGFGTEAAWRARAPELFITDQFYIVPMWQAVAEIPDGEINTSLVSVSEMRATTKLALPALDGSFIDEHLEVLSVAYNAMQVAAVPNPANLNYQSLVSLYPTYQNFAASEPGFANMSAAAKLFSVGLNAALAVAAGATESEFYVPRVEGGSTYVPYVVNVVEHYVITKESFQNNVEG